MLGDRELDRDRRTVDAVHPLEREQRCRERRSRGAGADQGVRVALGDVLRGEDDRRAGLLVHCADRLVLVRDRVLGAANLDAVDSDQRHEVGLEPERPHAYPIARGGLRAGCDHLGPAVGSTRVERDRQRAARWVADDALWLIQAAYSSVASAARSATGSSIAWLTTSLPAYVPQVGQTRWGSRGLWHCGHSLSLGAELRSCARRESRRADEVLFLGTAMTGEMLVDAQGPYTLRSRMSVNASSSARSSSEPARACCW